MNEIEISDLYPNDHGKMAAPMRCEVLDFAVNRSKQEGQIELPTAAYKYYDTWQRQIRNPETGIWADNQQYAKKRFIIQFNGQKHEFNDVSPVTASPPVGETITLNFVYDT